MKNLIRSLNDDEVPDRPVRRPTVPKQRSLRDARRLDRTKTLNLVVARALKGATE
jgi:hypothetical protein